jgi:DNA mismatch repair protein MutL
VLFDVSLHDVSIIQEHETVFKKLGFDIDLLGRNTVRVTAVPSLFKDRNIIELLTEFINDISQNESIKSIDVRSERMISYLACRSAVKAGDVLNQDEMKDLLNQLRKTKNPYTCPHGRPIQHMISLLELHRLFRRK